jgi:hypothetical protein
MFIKTENAQVSTFHQLCIKTNEGLSAGVTAAAANIHLFQRYVSLV